MSAGEPKDCTVCMREILRKDTFTFSGPRPVFTEEDFLAPYREKEVVIRPWGKYETVHIGSEFVVKIITVNPGQRLSLQRHRWRDEHWFIVEGKADVTIEGVNYGLFTYNHINIANGKWHRITNNQQTPLVLIEVQTGNCFEEDIERLEDDYNRV